MFDVLVYLYETYYRPDACPTGDALARKLSAVGFDAEEITQALGWLTDLKETTGKLDQDTEHVAPLSTGFRLYHETEQKILGTAAIGFIQFLESAKMLSSAQREVVIDRALAACEREISLDKLKVIVLMVMWTQGKEPDALMFDELFLDEDADSSPTIH